MSRCKKLLDNLKLKYLKILSDTSLEKYKNKKYNFMRFLSYISILYVLSISIFIVILEHKNAKSNELNHLTFKNSTSNFSSNYSNDDPKYKLRKLEIFQNENVLIKLLSLNKSKFIFSSKNSDFQLISKLENVYMSPQNLQYCLEKENNKTEIRKLFNPNIKIRELYILLENIYNDNINENSLRNIMIMSNSSDLIIKENLNINYSETNISVNNHHIEKLVILQGSIILIETLLIVSFIIFSFMKTPFNYLLYKMMSFLCCFNNFVQFQLLSLIFTKISKNDFHSRYTIPYIHSATTIFFTTFIDSDYIINSVAAFSSGILIFIFSIGYDWIDDQSYIMGGLLLLFFCFFTFKIEIDKQNLFLIYENNKNNLKNLMSSLENLNSGIIVYRKNESFECNKKFVEIFKINLDFAQKEKLDNHYLKYILFTQLTELNSNLGKSFLKTIEDFHKKFLEYEKNLFDLILASEEHKKLEEEITIENLVNNFENNYSNQENLNEELILNDRENYVNINEKDMNINISNLDLLNKDKNEKISLKNGNDLKNLYINKNSNNNNNLNYNIHNYSQNNSNILKICPKQSLKQDGQSEISTKGFHSTNIEKNNKKSDGLENKELNKLIEEQCIPVKENEQNFEKSSNYLSDFNNFNSNIDNINNMIRINKIDEEVITFKNTSKKNLPLKNNQPNNKTILKTKDTNNSLRSVKNGDLKKIIKSKSLRNTQLISQSNNSTLVNGLQQSIHDLEKKSKFHKKIQENSINYNESNLNLFSFNNSYNNETNLNFEILNAARENKVNICIENDKNIDDTSKVDPIETTKIKPRRIRSTLYRRIKEDELRAEKQTTLNNLKNKIEILRQKVSEANEVFNDFKTFFFNNTNSAKYTYLATKRFTVDNEDYIYRIYFRYNDIGDSLEFLIDDLSSVLRVEDLKSQYKYKKYFLDKFSHEFRNPILNIKQLVRNVKTAYDEYCSKLKKAINIDYTSTMRLIMNPNINRKNTTNDNENENENKSKFLYVEGVDVSGTKLNLNLCDDNKTYKSFETDNKLKNSSLNVEKNLMSITNKISDNNKPDKNEIQKSITGSAILKNNTNLLPEKVEIDYKKKSHNNLRIYNNIRLGYDNNFKYNQNNKNNRYINERNNSFINNADFKNVKFLDTNLINFDNIQNKNMKHDLHDNRILDNFDPIIDQNLKDSNFLPILEDLRINKLSNLKKIVFSDETKIELFSDLRHIKHLCEYMSMLISDFDYISNSQTSFLERIKIVKPVGTYDNRNDNLSNNFKDKTIYDLPGHDIIRLKSQSYQNKISTWDFNNNKENYSMDNFDSNDDYFNSSYLNRLPSKEILIEKTSIEIRKFLNKIVKIFQSKIFLSDKKILIEYFISSKVPEKITHDQAKLKLIIFNLLCNSVKFTASGLIRIEVDTDNNNNLIFDVLDSGIGIKQENIEKLLIPINIISISENTQQGPMGMGFFIIRKYLNLLEGDITIQSCYGLGTLIEIKIPLYLSREQTTYTLLVNEENASNINLTQNFNSNQITSEKVKRPQDNRSYTPMLDKKIKEKFDLKSVMGFVKSKTQNHNIYLIKEQNNSSFSPDKRRRSQIKKIDLQNLKANSNINHFRNNYYPNSNNNYNLMKKDTKQTLNKKVNNFDVNSRSKDLNNSEIYNTNFHRPNLIDDLKSTKIIREIPNLNINNKLVSNSNENCINNSNINLASPTSNYNLTFIEKDAKTVVLSDPSLIINYNNLSPYLQFFECNSNTPRNYITENSENLQDNSISQSNICYSQEDIKATVRINNQNFNVNNLILGENVYYIKNTTGACNFNNLKSKSTLKSNFSIIHKNSNNNLNIYDNNNINNNHISKSGSGNIDVSNLINNNNINNYNILSKNLDNNSSINNVYKVMHQNSNGSNNIANLNYNLKASNKWNRANFDNINKKTQVKKSEKNLIGEKNMVKYSQNNLNNFISFQNSIRILLVDDERLIRQSGKNVINKYFKKKGISFELEECADGVECLFKIYDGIKNGIKYDLIITDETMNFMKGSTTAKILKELMKDNIMYYLKIIMVTSYEISSISPHVKENLHKIFTKPLSTNTLDLIFAKD